MILEVVGVNELARNLVGLGRRFSAKTPLEAAVLRAGNIIAAEAARLAPKDTGKGAASMAARIISSRRGVVTAAIGPGRKQFYMMFQELGTSKHPPQPHLRPAVESHGRRAILAIGEFYREELKAFRRSGGAPRRIEAA